MRLATFLGLPGARRRAKSGAILGAVLGASAGLTWPTIAQPAARPATAPTLTVPLIMQAPAQWVGTAPSRLRWSPDSRTVYFDWNPARLRHDSLYAVSFAGQGAPTPVPARIATTLPDTERGVFDRARRRLVYARGGDLFVYDVRQAAERRLTLTADAESQPAWLGATDAISFRRNDNLFRLDLATGALTQLTDLRPGSAPAKPGKNAQRTALERQQVALFDVLRERQEARAAGESDRPPGSYKCAALAQASVPRRPAG